MKKYLRFIWAIPALIFANTSQEFAEMFAEKLKIQDTLSCYDILEDWERSHVEDFNHAEYFHLKALRASVLMSEGKLEESCAMMSNALIHFEESEISSENIALIGSIYRMIWKFVEKTTILEKPVIILCSDSTSPGYVVPSGTQVKYVTGSAMIIGGIILEAPSGGLSTGLIISGGVLCIDALTDAINDKEKYDRR